jgi:hypothetical protein
MKVLLFLTSLLISGVAAASTLQIGPIGDAMVSSSHQTLNYGADAKLTVVQSSSEIDRSFLQFKVSGISNPIQSAKVRLYVVEGSVNAPQLVRSGMQWDEMKVTYGKQPNLYTAIADNGAVSSGGWIEYDVTKLVQRVGNSAYSFALLPQSADSITFSSKEGSNPPQLIIDMDATSSSPTPSPTPTASATPSPTPISSPTPSSSGTQARSADSVVESMGVTAHLNWGGSVYDTGYSAYRPLLGALGIRYIRTNAASNALSKFDDLYASFGIRFNFTMMLLSNGALDASQIPSKLAYIKNTIGVEKVSSIEGANEYNSFASTNPNWATEDRNFQAELYKDVKADSSLRQLPVIGPSIWKRIYADFVSIGNIDQNIDYANLHYYTFGRKPTLFSNGTMDDAINWAKILAPTSPCVWVTETGYDQSTPQRVTAKYMLRMYLEFFNRCGNGSGKTYLYDLIDDTKAYGMLDANLKPRPVYFAVKNLIKILSDKGAAFTPSSLNYSIAGDQTNIHKTILQKHDGRFYMLIWQDVDSQTSSGAEANVPLRSLSLDVSKHNFAKMNVYLPTGLDMADPNNGAIATQSIAAPSVVPINVPDHVMVLEFVP